MVERTEKLEVRQSVDGLHHYLVKVGKNGEDLWTSEMYTRKETAMDSAEREKAANPELQIIDTTDGVSQR